MKKRKCYENKWSVSANDLSLFQCFCAKKISEFHFFFENLASCLKLVARERISSSQRKFLLNGHYGCFSTQLELEGILKPSRYTASSE